MAAGTMGSLSALLSQALVAFTIEFDNEAEHRLPHRTTNHGPSGHGDGVWLVSLVMWENCMRFVGDEPVTVAELEILARTGTNLDGMRRWGYITIDGTSGKPRKGRPGPAAVLRATAKGLRARQVWLPLPGLIEQRWQERFGAAELSRLRESLIAVVSRLDPGLPDCLPILGPALLSRDLTLRSRPDLTVPTFLGCRFRRCCPGRCCRSPSSTSANAACRWRSARTCCASLAPRGPGSATFPS